MHRACRGFEAVVFRYLATKQQGATKGCHAFDMAPKFDLLGKQGIASVAIFGAFVRKVRFVFCCQFGCWSESCSSGHSVLLGVWSPDQVVPSASPCEERAARLREGYR